jgi:hypothetical protein
VVLSLGLSTADQKLFDASLSTGYNLKVTVQILDLNHRYLHDASPQLIDGQVNFSYWEPITYSASLTLLDPDNLTGFDTSSPSDNALYADRMIRIVYSVHSDLLPRWVDCPIFCGPVTKVKRDDAILSIECQGKESLYSEPTLAWSAKTYAKGTLLTTAIRDVMAAKGGETRFEFPGWTTTLAKDYSLTPESVPWTFVLALAGHRSVRHLYYDGRGVLKLRDGQTTPSWTFSEDRLLSVPKLDYNHAEIRNTVLFKGGTPTGKPQITARAYLPDPDPSSPKALGINGVRRYLAGDPVEDTSVMTQTAANARAQSVLASLALANIGFDFDSFVVPHMEPGDTIHLSTRDTSVNLRMSEYAIPLKAGNPQSNGLIRKLSVNKARLRR